MDRTRSRSDQNFAVSSLAMMSSNRGKHGTVGITLWVSTFQRCDPRRCASSPSQFFTRESLLQIETPRSPLAFLRARRCATRATHTGQRRNFCVTPYRDHVYTDSGNRAAWHASRLVSRGGRPRELEVFPSLHMGLIASRIIVETCPEHLYGTP